MINLAVIASLKKGLELFAYRELCEFAAEGFTIHIFPTKYQTGTYNGPRSWFCPSLESTGCPAVSALFFSLRPGTLFETVTGSTEDTRARGFYAGLVLVGQLGQVGCHIYDLGFIREWHSPSPFADYLIE